MSEQYPWDNSTGKISSQMDGQFETPMGAQAKADAAREAAEDVADAALQAHRNMGGNEHPVATDSISGFLSGPDKAKLNTVQSGAETNQLAFSKINNIVATSKTDTLELIGGTGVTVTTDPVMKRATITATGQSTPGAHASSHLTGGSDPIPVANATNSGLMSYTSYTDLQNTKTGLATVQNRVIDIGLNVKDYGAIGDGVTDDAASIQATFDAAVNLISTKDVLVGIFFPSGRYLMNSQATMTLPGTTTTKLYNGISIFGTGNNGTKIIAGENNQTGLFKITMPTYKHFVWVRDINFVSNLDQNTGVSKNNGTGLWITSPNDPGKMTPGLNSDYSVIVEDCHWHSDKVDEGDAQSRSGVWYRCLQIDFAYVPIVQRCQFRSPLDSASPTYTGSNHDAAIHMQHCYAPDIRHNTIDGYYTAACRNIGTVTSTSQASGSWEGGFFINNLVANALDGLVITHAFSSEPNLYEPGFHFLGNHINVRRFGVRVKYHGLIVMSDNYCFVAPSQPGTETLPAVIYLEQATTVNIHGNQFDSPGFYNSDTNASVAIRVDGYSSGVFINGNQFNHGGISIYNNNVQSTNTTDIPRSVIASNNAWSGKKNSSWATNIKYVDLTRNMLVWEVTQNASQDQMEFTSRTANANNSPKMLMKRYRSDYNTKKTDIPLSAFGFIGLNDQGGEREFAKIRVEATNNTNAAERGSIVFTVLVNGSEQQLMKLNGFNGAIETAKLIIGGSAKVANYAKASLPSASDEGAGAMIYVTDDVGGGVIAFSDGSSWRRVTDRNVIS